MKNNKTPSIFMAILFIVVSLIGIYFAGLQMFPELCLYPQMDLKVAWCWIMILGFIFMFISMFSMFLMGIDMIIIKKRQRGFTTLRLLHAISLFCLLAGFICGLFTAFPLNLTILIVIFPVLVIMAVYTAKHRIHIKELKNNITLAAVEAGAMAVIVSMLFFAGVTACQYKNLFISNQNISESNNFKTFSAECFDGTTITQDYFKDHKITMINCWETTCSPCIRELPYLQEEYEERYGDDFAIIGICSDLYQGGSISEATLNDAKMIIADNKVEYPIIIPSKGMMNGVIRNITAYPTTFLVDSQGNIIKIVMGSKEKSAWDDIINKCLK